MWDLPEKAEGGSQVVLEQERVADGGEMQGSLMLGRWIDV